MVNSQWFTIKCFINWVCISSQHINLIPHQHQFTEVLFSFLVAYNNAFSYHSKVIFVTKTIPLPKELSLHFHWFSMWLAQQSSINGCSNGSLKQHYLRHWQVNAVGRFSGKIKFTFLYHRLPLFCLILVILFILLSFHLLVRRSHTAYLRLAYDLWWNSKYLSLEHKVWVGTARESLLPSRGQTQSTQI